MQIKLKLYNWRILHSEKIRKTVENLNRDNSENEILI